MTNEEFLTQWPLALEILDWVASNPARAVTEAGLHLIERRTIRAMVTQGLVSYATRVPEAGLVATYYKITANGWLALRRKEP